jgi:CYTH domain-containing protein
MTRDETKLSIPGFLFDLLWPFTGSNVVRKTRYLLDNNNLVLEVDVYSGKHEGLITLECEFRSTEQAELFELPEWIGPAIDVTDDPRFKNKELSRSRKTPDL